MAEEEEKKEESQDGESQKKKPMLLIIVGVVALLLIIAIVAVIFILGGEEQPEDINEPKKAASAKTQTKKVAEVALGPIIPLEMFIVNLLSDSGRRYLKAEISLELSAEEISQEVTNKAPLLRDVIIRTLSSKTFEEVSTENGKERLKEEIKTNIDNTLVDGFIKNIFFTKFVVQ